MTTTNKIGNSTGVRLSYLNKYYKLDESTYILKIYSNSYGEFEVLIDSDFVDVCNKYTWSMNKQSSRFLVAAYVKGSYPSQKRVYLHRLVTDFKYKLTDHINGNPLDNRKANLRNSSPSKNQANRRNHKSRNKYMEGVCKVKSRYGSRLIFEGSAIYIGTYDSEIEAHESYVKKHIELFGEHSKWNKL
jgi:hypothetical protein